MKLMKITMAGLAGLAFGAALTAVAVPASAHHSFAMFANDKTITLKGTVKELEWTNPHAWLHVVIVNAAGKSENWAFEMASPAQLSVRSGWKPDTLKPGDTITLQMHPMRDGSRAGSYVAVKLPNGSVLGNWQGDTPT